MRKNQPTSYTTTRDFINEIADTHRIHPMEATDEVWDAIDILWAPEDRPGVDLTTDQTRTLREYIAEQYRTNRTRIDGK